jgi:hypothetical protein
VDRPPPRPSPGDEHWAPDHLVLVRHVFAYAGRLLVERDEQGQVLLHRPLDGMAAVDQRYPGWARGPFGQIEPERELPGTAGVYALVEGGVVRYVGSSRDLVRTFGPRGVGEISRRDCQSPGSEEFCRLNRRIAAEAVRGRTTDLYLLVTGARRGAARTLIGRRPAAPTALAAEIAGAARGAWQLPT